MASAIELFGWFVFNVAIPLLAPLALLPLAKLPYFFREQSHGIVRRAIEGGQLLWAAIPMSASACYLLATTLDEATWNRQYMWMGIATHVFLIVFASSPPCWCCWAPWRPVPPSHAHATDPTGSCASRSA